MSEEKKPRVLPHLTQEGLERVLDEYGRAHWFTHEGRPVCGRHKKEVEAYIKRLRNQLKLLTSQEAKAA